MTLGDIQIKYHIYYSLYTGCDRQHNYNTITAKQYRALYSSGSRGRGARGSAPPLLGHDVGFLTLGPKLDPLLDPPPLFLLVDLRWTPVADPGGGAGVITPPWTCTDTENLCKVCVTGTDHPPPPWNVDDVTRAMSKGGGACECPRVGVFFNFSEGGWRHADNVQGGGVLVNVQEVGVSFNLSEGGWRHAGNVQGGCACECLHPPPSGIPVSAPGPPPPPFKNPGSAPAIALVLSIRNTISG